MPTTDDPPTAAPIDYVEVQRSDEFQRLRRTHRSFTLPLTLSFLAWFFVFVLLGAFARDFMAIRLFGTINVGLVLGLLQFVTTFGITAWYLHWANATYDPEATAIRADLEELAREEVVQ